MLITVSPVRAAEKLATSTAGTFPSLSATTNTPTVSSTTPLTTTSTQLRAHELIDSPMAPLPPALIAGPIGIFLATWTAHRANRRGGKI